MNTKYLVVVAAMTAMLVAATALVTTDSAFAGKKGYSKSQASAQASDCGNGFISVANFCQEIGAQNQGEENSAAQSGNQEINLHVDLGRTTGTIELCGDRIDNDGDGAIDEGCQEPG